MQKNTKKDFSKFSLELHRKNKGKLEVKSKVPLKNSADLSAAYTPGVAAPCLEIAKNSSAVYDYTIKGNTVAIITDGTRVLGLGSIGPEASLPVMEGKAILFKELANVDAFPIPLATKDTEEIVRTCKIIAPVFGGINLEDIETPKCYDIEEKLQDIGIPVMHDDQHGTAIALVAALINAAKVAGKNIEDLKVVVNGAGAAGTAIAKILTCLHVSKNVCTRVKDAIILDSKGIIYEGRDNLDKYKEEIASMTNKSKIKGTLKDALYNADVLISAVGNNTKIPLEYIKLMGQKPIVFALSNPVPEIYPDEAKKAGAFIVGTGRSDFPNQINNALAFPGIFRGALDAKATRITNEMKIAAVHAIVSCIKNPTKDKILPSVLDKKVHKKVAAAVKQMAIKQGVVRQ